MSNIARLKVMLRKKNESVRSESRAQRSPSTVQGTTPPSNQPGSPKERTQIASRTQYKKEEIPPSSDKTSSRNPTSPLNLHTINTPTTMGYWLSVPIIWHELKEDAREPPDRRQLLHFDPSFSPTPTIGAAGVAGIAPAPPLQTGTPLAMDPLTMGFGPVVVSDGIPSVAWEPADRHVTLGHGPVVTVEPTPGVVRAGSTLITVVRTSTEES